MSTMHTNCYILLITSNTNIYFRRLYQTCRVEPFLQIIPWSHVYLNTTDWKGIKWAKRKSEKIEFYFWKQSRSSTIGTLSRVMFQTQEKRIQIFFHEWKDHEKDINQVNFYILSPKSIKSIGICSSLLHASPHLYNEEWSNAWDIRS